MNRLKPWIIAALAAAMTLSIMGVASAQPSPPPLFTGTVTNADGSAVAAGLSVEAYVDETNCTFQPTQTYIKNGQTKYTVLVSRSSSQQGCVTSGSEVSFRVGNRWATQTATISLAGSPTLNLTLGAPTVTINVAVWRHNEDPFNALARLFISTQAPGERWVTHDDDGPLTMTLSTSGNWHRSDITPVQVELSDGTTTTIDVAVWRNVATPTTLFISTRVPGEGWITHDDDGPLKMTLNSSGTWYRSDLTALEVEIE